LARALPQHGLHGAFITPAACRFSRVEQAGPLHEQLHALLCTQCGHDPRRTAQPIGPGRVCPIPQKRAAEITPRAPAHSHMHVHRPSEQVACRIQPLRPETQPALELFPGAGSALGTVLGNVRANALLSSVHQSCCGHWRSTTSHALVGAVRDYHRDHVQLDALEHPGITEQETHGLTGALNEPPHSNS